MRFFFISFNFFFFFRAVCNHVGFYHLLFCVSVCLELQSFKIELIFHVSSCICIWCLKLQTKCVFCFSFANSWCAQHAARCTQMNKLKIIYSTMIINLIIILQLGWFNKISIDHFTFHSHPIFAWPHSSAIRHTYQVQLFIRLQQKQTTTKIRLRPFHM